MKKLDRLLISSFIPPFMVTFAIAIFVLLMQILWLYIDDIAGKGLGFFILIELLAYKCVSLIPMALPLAMLISSVMVMGNLAEHYELSSFKSAGVSLRRVMAPLMFMGVLVTLSSYFCSNNLIPVANLKFGSRMYDIQQQKPALRLDVGVFNDDFDGYAIHIGDKEGDSNIEEVLIYDHSEANRGRLGQIMAKEGEMYATDDGSYFVMNLREGHQYIETKPSGYGRNQNHPFVRTNFDSWQKVFDLSEFQLNRTNEELFKQNRSMLSTSQLAEAVDSLEYRIKKRERTMSNTVAGYFR
ncbi:MAG: LptF/LptG family permease, partial [Saprospiraceae bacterium]|nr:LptF/LptG family permease [Saprospiraceae bacterium]